jgi:hypothetical protein
MSTTPAAELIDFAEAAGPFMEPAPGRLLRVTERFTLAGEVGHTWAAVERIRLQGDAIAEAVADVDAFMREAGNARASWWLTERSTPGDLEERLLAAGCRRDESDYLHAALVLTREPPAVDGIEARRIETFAEFVESRRLQRGVFGSESVADFEAEWEQLPDPVYAAWIDGRMACVGRAVFTRVGGYLMGGATAEWARGRGAYRAVVRARWDEAVRRGTPALAVGAGPMSRPILERLGFEQVLQFRRIESVRSADGD